VLLAAGLGGQAQAATPFNLESNHVVNGGGTLTAVSPTATLPAGGTSPTWLYDFGAYGFTDLNMQSFKIATDNGDSFNLDLGGGQIAGSGDLSTARGSGAAGSICATNAGPIVIGTISAIGKGRNGHGGDVSIYHRGALTVGDVSTYIDSDQYSHAGRITFNGDTGTASGSKGPFESGSLLAYNHNQGGAYDNSVSIQGYTTVLIGGAVSTYVGYRGNNGGSLTIGAESPGRVGDVTICGKVDLHARTEYGGNGGYSGSLGVYSTGNVLFQDASSVAQDIVVNQPIGGRGGSVTITHDGQLVFQDINADVVCGVYDGGAQNILFNGNVLADDASGALTGRDILGYTSSARQPGRNITISGYTGVSLRNLDTRVGPDIGKVNKSDAGSISITGIAGPVSISGNIDASAADSLGSAGSITIDATGDVIIGGSVKLTALQGANYYGTLTLTASGGSSSVRMGDQDLSLVKSVTLDAGGGQSYITNALLNFATAYTSGAGTAGNPYLTSQTALQTPDGQMIEYNTKLAANSYLNGAYYRIADTAGTPAAGGLLKPQAGPRGTMVLVF